MSARRQRQAVLGRAGRQNAPGGFTLIEVILALTIGGIIAAGATAAMTMVYRSTLRLEKQAAVDEDAKLLLDALLGDLQEVGGGSIRPHMAVWLEDDAATSCSSAANYGAVTLNACGSSDRLHFLLIDDASPQCAITSADPANGTVNYASTSECCTAGNTDLASRDMVIVAPDGEFQARHCTTQNTSAPSCSCSFSSSNSGYITPASPTANYSGGFVTRGTSVTLFVEDNTLKMMQDRDDDGVMEASDEVRLAPNVFSFQVELGFDTDGDNKVDTWRSDYDPNFVDRDELRMLRIGLVVGTPVPSRETATTGQVLSGPAVTETSGWLFRSVSGATAVRNLYLFY